MNDVREMLSRTAASLRPGQPLFSGSTVRELTDTHEYYGFHQVKGGWVYREWAPDAKQVYLTGDFNGWDTTSDPMLDMGNGSWVLYLPGDDALWESCRVKTVVKSDL